MSKLNFTKQEVEDIKSKIYLTDDEEKVLDMWLKEETIVAMSMKLGMSTSTISNKKKNILKKIVKIL